MISVWGPTVLVFKAICSPFLINLCFQLQRSSFVKFCNVLTVSVGHRFGLQKYQESAMLESGHQLVFIASTIKIQVLPPTVTPWQ